jgi:PIN domain nuclease of toxin-antitoxin system
MKLLLDTHALLWWLDDPAKLSSEARAAVGSRENAVYVSAATAWEIVIKKALGKLAAPDDLAGALEACRFSPLPVTVEHAQAVRDLPLHHHDPFDRMLVAQTKVEGLTIVTRDAEVQHYSVPHLVA